MKVISWNVLHGQRVPVEEKSLDLTGACNQLGADLLGVQEVDENQPRSGGSKQVEAIAAAMGTVHWAYARTVIGTPGEMWRRPESSESLLHTHFSEPSYGIGLISKIPVRTWHRIELGRSWIGLPLPIPSDKGMRWAYVRDEPRVALIAELENSYTVAVTHLSFVPFVNYFQLRKLQRVMKHLPGRKLIIGDLNLGWNIPGRFTRWKSLVSHSTYPAWKPAIQFDYILAPSEQLGSPLEHLALGISDHLSIGVELY